MPSQPAAVCALLVVGCALWTHLCGAVTYRAAAPDHRRLNLHRAAVRSPWNGAEQLP